jgi:hypothetical protein
MNRRIVLEPDLSPGGFERLLRLEPETAYEFNMAAYAPGYGLDIRAVIIEIAEGREVANQDIGWFAFLPRTEFAFEFRTGATEEYRLELRISGGAEAGLEIEYIRLNSLAITGSRGIYTHPIMRDFDPAAAVPAKWVADRIRMRGALNQTLAVLAAFQSDAAFDGVTLEIAPPPGISAGCFDVRMIRDQVLLPAQPAVLGAGERRGWWITFTPDETLKAGTHGGALKVMDGDRVLEEIPLILDILDLRLPEPDIAFLQYHSERYIPGEFLNEKLRRAYYEDMRRHGMNTITVYNNPDVDGSRLDVGHNWQFSAEELELRRERGAAPGQETEESWRKKFEYGLARELETVREAGLGIRFPVLWLAGKISYSSDRNDWWGGMNPVLLRELYCGWRQEWPRPLYYVIDEPSGIRERTEKALELLEALKNTECGIPLVSANIDDEPLGHYYRVWIQAISRIDEAMCRAAADKQAELWAYCCSTSNRVTAQPRAMFGFWAARTGVKGVAQWAYYDARDGFADGVDRSRCCLSRIGLSPEGPIPTSSWEATREGVTDYRIVQLCRRYVGRLRECGQAPGAEALLEECEKTMTCVLNSVAFNLFAPLADSGSFGDRHSFRPILGLGDQETIFEQKRATLWKLIEKVDSYLKSRSER